MRWHVSSFHLSAMVLKLRNCLKLDQAQKGPNHFVKSVLKIVSSEGR